MSHGPYERIAILRDALERIARIDFDKDYSEGDVMYEMSYLAFDTLYPNGKACKKCGKVLRGRGRIHTCYDATGAK